MDPDTRVTSFSQMCLAGASVQLNVSNSRTPRSSVPQDGATDTYFGQPHTGLIGRDLPKEIVRVQRTYALKDICQ